jgi:hypothetical protein
MMDEKFEPCSHKEDSPLDSSRGSNDDSTAEMRNPYDAYDMNQSSLSKAMTNDWHKFYEIKYQSNTKSTKLYESDI